jgi:hypothetical protein
MPLYITDIPVVETDLLNAYNDHLAIYGNKSGPRDSLNERLSPALVSAGTLSELHSHQKAVQSMFPVTADNYRIELLRSIITLAEVPHAMSAVIFV